MAVPSYARATSSSTLKAIPRPLKNVDSANSRDTPKKYKRPSTLTTEDRQTIAYRADLYPIKPFDPLKSCWLSELPSELRTVIYTYTLQDRPWRGKRRRYWPSLLHVCRAIRIEAAYTYFTSTPFRFDVINLNFSSVRQWVGTLAPSHRTLLTKNKQLMINVNPRIRSSYTYPPKDYILDDSVANHWQACEEFGNLYTVNGKNHRKHFIFFCRLASWWLWCARPVQKDMEWNYTFGDAQYRSEDISSLLRSGVSSIASPCVRKAWKRNKQKDKMAKEALSFLEALESTLKRPSTWEILSPDTMELESKLLKSAKKSLETIDGK